MANMYIQSINHFRAIAIFFVVFGHSFIISDYTPDTFTTKIYYNLATGGTTFFVFISGFLFHHLSGFPFNYRDFMFKKVKHVLVPFLLLSLIPLLVLFSNYVAHDQIQKILTFSLIRYYLIGIGGFFMGYWYIPFIMIVFLMSPLFIKFLKLPIRIQILITLLLLVGSVLLHRGTNRELYSVLQNVVYFIPVYTLGMVVSQKRDYLYTAFRGKDFLFFILAVGFALFQAFSATQGNFRKDPFVFGGIDLMILQKILLSLFFVLWLNRFERVKDKWIDRFAIHSFGIFFIQGIIIWIIKLIKDHYHVSFEHNSFLIYLVVGSGILTTSLIVTVIIKKLLPVHGKYLVGT